MADLWTDFDRKTPAVKPSAGADLWAEFDTPAAVPAPLLGEADSRDMGTPGMFIVRNGIEYMVPQDAAALAQAAKAPITDLGGVTAELTAMPGVTGGSSTVAEGARPSTLLGDIASAVMNPIDTLQRFTAPITRGIANADGMGALTRGATGLLASGTHAASDFVDQTVQAPMRGLAESLGVTGLDLDPLGAQALANESLAVNAEIGKERQAAMAALDRPGLADLIATPGASFERLGERYATMGVESAPAMALAVATRNPELASGVLGATTGAQEYTDLRGQGIARGTAAQAGTLSALVEMAGEGFSLPKVMGKASAGSLGGAAIAEGAQEFPVAIAQQNINDQATGKTTPILQQILDGLDAAVIGAGMGGAAHVGSNLPAYLSRDIAPAPTAPIATEAVPANAITPTPPELAQALRAQQSADGTLQPAPTVAPAGLSDITPEDLAAEDTADLDALLLKNLPAIAEALGLGDIEASTEQTDTSKLNKSDEIAADPDARFRRPAPESAPAAPSAIAATQTRSSLPVQTPTAAQAVQAPAEAVGSRPVGADLKLSEDPTAIAAARTATAPAAPLTALGEDAPRPVVPAPLPERAPKPPPVDAVPPDDRLGMFDDAPAPPLDIRYGKRNPAGAADLAEAAPGKRPEQARVPEAKPAKPAKTAKPEANPYKEGDTVKIVRGPFNGLTGEVSGAFGDGLNNVIVNDKQRGGVHRIHADDLSPAGVDASLSQDSLDRGVRGIEPASDSAQRQPLALEPDGSDAGSGRKSGRELGRESTPLEGSVNRVLRDAKPTADLLVSETFQLEGLGGLDIPSQRVVLDTMLSAGQDLQVRNAIIGSLPVDVVDMLRREQISPEMLFHDEAVLKGLLSADGEGSVATAVDVAAALSVAIAGVIAENALPQGKMLGRSSDGAAATGAGEGVDFHADSVTPSTEDGDSGGDLSREQGEADADTYGLREAVGNVLGEAGAKVEYLHGIEGLPERLRKGVSTRLEQRGGRGQTAALYDPATRRVYLFTDVVTSPGRAAFHAAHEIAGHDGLRTLLGKDLDKALNLALQNPTVKALADVMTKQRKLRPDQSMLAAEEALAELAAAVRTGNYDHIADRYKIAVPEGIRARLTAAIDNFLKRLKALFDQRGVTFKDSQVRELLEAAWQAVDGKGSSTQGEGLLESTDYTPEQQDKRSAAEGKAEAKRNVAADTLGVDRGSRGSWDFPKELWAKDAAPVSVGRKGARVKRDVRADYQDKMIAFRDVQRAIEKAGSKPLSDDQNVYEVENQMHGRVMEGFKSVERAQLEPLVKAMHAAGLDMSTGGELATLAGGPDLTELETYLWARHATERNADIAEKNPTMPDGGSGMTNAVAAAVLAQADTSKLEPLAKRVDAIVAGTRRRMLTHGLITQSQFDAMAAQYTSFVPLRGQNLEDTDPGNLTGNISGRGMDSRASVVKTALGRGAGNPPKSILGEILRDAQTSVVLAEKARVGRTLMRLVLANPNPLWSVEPVQVERRIDKDGEVYDAIIHNLSDPAIVVVRHKGELFKVQLNAPLAKAFSHVGVEQINQITRLAGTINRYFSAVFTKYNPYFLARNAVRDMIFGMTGLVAEHGETVALKAALYYPQAARAAWRHARNKPVKNAADRLFAEYIDDGGKTGFVTGRSVEDMAKSLGRGMMGYDPQGARRVGRALAEFIGDANDSVESALRFAAYATLRGKGVSRQRATIYSKDVTVNFNRKGFDGTAIGSWLLFFNPAMQGSKRFIDLAKKPKALGYMGGLAMIQALAMMAAMGDDDEEGEPIANLIPEHLWRRNIVLVIDPAAARKAFAAGETDGDNIAGLVTIPMPYGVNVLTYAAGRTVRAFMQDEARPEDTAAAVSADIITAAVEGVVPIPIGEGASGLVHPLLGIFMDVKANKNFFGGAIHNEFAKDNKPLAMQGKPATLEAYKTTARLLNRAGGGDDVTPAPFAWLNVAPEDIEYVLTELGGGPVRFVADLASFTGKAFDPNVTISPRDIPLTNAFVSNVDREASQQALYYNRKDSIERATVRVNAAYRRDGIKAAIAARDAAPELRGAGIKRRVKDMGDGKESGKPFLTESGNLTFVVGEPESVYAKYKLANKAMKARNDVVDRAYLQFPPTLRSMLPGDTVAMERNKVIRSADKGRADAQQAFNEAWTRDVVGFAE